MDFTKLKMDDKRIEDREPYGQTKRENSAGRATGIRRGAS